MMTLTRQEIEVLLDFSKQRHFVVSAYADMTVQDGFSRHVETHLRNQARAAAAQAVRASADAPGAEPIALQDLGLTPRRAAVSGRPPSGGSTWISSST